MPQGRGKKNAIQPSLSPIISSRPKVGHAAQGPHIGGRPNVSQSAQNSNVKANAEKANEKNKKKGGGGPYANAVRDTNKLYHRTRNDIKHIYNESGDYIRNKNRQNRRIFRKARRRTRKQNRNLLRQVNRTSNRNENAAMAAMAALGISTPGAMAQYNADAANNVSSARQAGFNSLATLGLMSAGSRSVGNLLAGMNAGSRSSALGAAEQARMDTLDDLRAAKHKQMQDKLRSMRANSQYSSGYSGYSGGYSYTPYTSGSYSSGYSGGDNGGYGDGSQAQTNLLYDLWGRRR